MRGGNESRANYQTHKRSSSKVDSSRKGSLASIAFSQQVAHSGRRRDAERDREHEAKRICRLIDGHGAKRHFWNWCKASREKDGCFRCPPVFKIEDLVREFRICFNHGWEKIRRTIPK